MNKLLLLAFSTYNTNQSCLKNLFCCWKSLEEDEGREYKKQEEVSTSGSNERRTDESLYTENGKYNLDIKITLIVKNTSDGYILYSDNFNTSLPEILRSTKYDTTLKQGIEGALDTISLINNFDLLIKKNPEASYEIEVQNEFSKKNKHEHHLSKCFTIPVTKKITPSKDAIEIYIDSGHLSNHKQEAICLTLRTPIVAANKNKIVLYTPENRKRIEESNEFLQQNIYRINDGLKKELKKQLEHGSCNKLLADMSCYYKGNFYTSSILDETMS